MPFINEVSRNLYLFFKSIRPISFKAIMCLEAGTASRDDIDKTLKLGMNHPMGPLQLGDLSVI